MISLRPFQRRFVAKATAPGIDTACPRNSEGKWKKLAGRRIY